MAVETLLCSAEHCVEDSREVQRIGNTVLGKRSLVLAGSGPMDLGWRHLNCED